MITSPINYLVMIEMQDILPNLFKRVIIPKAVYNELQHEKTPERVKNWLSRNPDWLEVVAVGNLSLPSLNNLDQGEKEAIQLADELNADALLMDEKDGRKAAAKLGFITIGTLGILDRAADRGLISFEDAINRLRETPFREPIELVQQLLVKHHK